MIKANWVQQTRSHLQRIKIQTLAANKSLWGSMVSACFNVKPFPPQIYNGGQLRHIDYEGLVSFIDDKADGKYEGDGTKLS
jgi:hypothetical protein